MRTYTGSFQSEKRPLTIPVLNYSLAMIPFENKMAAQAGYASPVASFCCLRQSEYTVSDSVSPSKYLILRKVLFPIETATPGKGNACFHEEDWKANKE